MISLPNKNRRALWFFCFRGIGVQVGLSLKFTTVIRISPAALHMVLLGQQVNGVDAWTAQHIREIVGPAIEQGKIVLCDRYTDSTLAYQGYGRGIDHGLLRRLNDMASQGIRPDLTFLFDCPVELGLSRTAQRQFQTAPGGKREDRFEREKIEFHERVRAGFLALARAEPDRFWVIDASRSVEEISEEIKTVVDRKLA